MPTPPRGQNAREMTRDGDRNTWISILVAAALPVFLYFGAYFWARANLVLVHYAGGFIARPHVGHGIGFSRAELIFLPATTLEVAIRSGLDPTW